MIALINDPKYRDEQSKLKKMLLLGPRLKTNV